MTLAVVTPVDLQTKRRKKGDSQEAFGQLLGISRQQIQNYESGKRNIPTDKACESALILGSLTLEYKGKKFELKPLQEDPQPNCDEESPLAGSWSDNAFNSAQQARELQEWSEALAQHLVSIKNGRGAEAYLVRGYKEAREAQLAIQQLFSEGKRKHPHLVELGIEMARRVAAVQREGGCQFAAMEAFLTEVADRLVSQKSA